MQFFVVPGLSLSASWSLTGREPTNAVLHDRTRRLLVQLHICGQSEGVHPETARESKLF